MANTYELIETYSVTTPVATVTFGAGGTLTQAYTDLVILCSSRSSRTSDNIDDINLKFNNATSGYSLQNLSVNQIAATNSTMSVDGTTSASFLYRNAMPANTTTAGAFGVCEFYVTNYSSNAYYKAVKASHSSVVNADYTGNYIGQTGGLYKSATPITSVQLVCDQASFMQYSVFSIYGIKQA
jgi:hypothetical protein